MTNKSNKQIQHRINQTDKKQQINKPKNAKRDEMEKTNKIPDETKKKQQTTHKTNQKKQVKPNNKKNT